MASAERQRCIPCEDGLALIAAALVVRFAWAAVAHQIWGWTTDNAYDDGVFLHMARGLLGQEPLLVIHPPGYPLFIAPFIAVGGDLGISLARWATILISTLTPVFVYRLVIRLGGSRVAALIAGSFIVFSPTMIFFSARLMSEPLFVTLVTAFLYVWLGAWESGRNREAVLAGVLGGAASLVRGAILPFGGVLALVALWKRREQSRWAFLVFYCGLSWTLMMVPWTLRNWREFHRFVPLSVQGGWNFYEGLTVDPEEIRHKRAEAMGDEVRALGLTDPFASDAYFSAKTHAWIKANPGEFLRLTAIKALRFWRPAPEPPHRWPVRLATGVFMIVLFAAALLGLRVIALFPGVIFLFAWVIHLNIIHAVFASNLRYRLPIEPVLAVLAGFGLAALLPSIRPKS